MVSKIIRRSFRRYPELRKQFWQRVYQFLAGRYYQRADWSMMNYGYLPLVDDDPRPELLPTEEGERLQLQLYHHVAGAVTLQGRHVLEVGSGRGGGAAFVARYFKPARLYGLDFSEKAVSLCNLYHARANLHFVPGDAEAVPFAPAQFDAVINIESSHCYGNMTKFLAAVYRVLRPGGYFLLADFRGQRQMAALRRQLTHSGLLLSQERNITPNVLAALKQDEARKMGLIENFAPRWLHGPLREFAAVRGSQIYRGFQTERMVYSSFVLQKPPR